MITVVIPTLNEQSTLGSTLASLVPAAVEGLVRQVVVVDGGSSDRTLDIAEGSGADVMRTSCGRGSQLKAGAAAARFPWLLFLHADTMLEQGWEREAGAFMERVDDGKRPPSAAAFRFALDDLGFKPRLLETIVATRCALLRLPYGDQGLLIPRALYQEIGGYQAMPLMEDVDMIRRLGRGRTVLLHARAITSAERYRSQGYIRRVARNLSCLTLYYLRVPPRTIAKLYEQA